MWKDIVHVKLTYSSLTDPQVIEPLAHGATLVRDLIEVLVKTWPEWDESWQGREVVFWDNKRYTVQNAAARTLKTLIQKSSQDSCMWNHNSALSFH